MTVNGERAAVLAHVDAAGATYRCIGGGKTDTLDQCSPARPRGERAGRPRPHLDHPE